MPEPCTWLEDGRLAACQYPRTAVQLHALARRGVTLLINLHERPHPPQLLTLYGLTELHLPVPDFTPPTAAQLDQGVAAITAALEVGKIVAVHCGAGLGRTGTLIACYWVRQGLHPTAAIARIRAARPGSVETREQEEAVRSFANVS